MFDSIDSKRKKNHSKLVYGQNKLLFLTLNIRVILNLSQWARINQNGSKFNNLKTIGFTEKNVKHEMSIYAKN